MLGAWLSQTPPQLAKRLFAETYPVLTRRLGWSVVWARK
jgi:hypothetical protein